MGRAELQAERDAPGLTHVPVGHAPSAHILARHAGVQVFGYTIDFLTVRPFCGRWAKGVAKLKPGTSMSEGVFNA